MGAAPDRLPASPGQALDYRVRGMDCAEEVGALRAALKPLPGVLDLRFDLLARRLTVLHDPGRVDDQQLRGAVARTGMRAEPWTDEDPGLGLPRVRAWAAAASGAALLAGFVLHVLSGGGLLAAATGGPRSALVSALYLAAVGLGAAPVLPGVLHALRRLRPDMHLLMMVAVAGALALGEWFEAGTVTFLFALSLVLEAWSTARARSDLAALLDLVPDRAYLLCLPSEPRGESAGPRAVAAREVPVGSLVLVRPGERLPLDGVVEAGESDVDASPITGEATPVAVGPGQEVFAGSINGSGALELRTTRAASETQMAQVLRLVGEARGRRSRSERFVERFARVYTPAVLALAAGTCLLGPVLGGGSLVDWIYPALVLLVISCPCALVISTPVSIASARAAAARAGVLIKDGRTMEEPGRLRCLALDKTGTLTRGRPVVSCVLPLDGHDEAGVLALAAAIETSSTHPLARAIVDHAPPTARSVRHVRSLDGRGLCAEVDGRAYWLGSHRLLEERKQETPAVHATLERLEQEGHSVVVLGNDEHVCGFIALRDEPRPEARRAVAALHALGLSSVVMLTGDNAGTARRVARQLGIDDARAELLPADKVDAVAELVRQHGSVAMVGDGVNDAPALARATLGVAMGAAGTDVAVETADVVILSDDLQRLPWLVRHSRRTVGVIRQNILAAVGVKVLFLALAWLGWSTLWGAIAADMGVSLLVVGNALRLLRPVRDDLSAAGARA